MRRASAEARDHHDLWPARRYSTRYFPTTWVPPLAAVVGRNAPSIRTCSLPGPSAVQMRTLGVVRGTRFTGTVTVSPSQPASRTPRVMTSGPDIAQRVTLGPVFAANETRIAEVPRGSVPAFTHPPVPGVTDARAFRSRN